MLIDTYSLRWQEERELNLRVITKFSLPVLGLLMLRIDRTIDIEIQTRMSQSTYRGVSIIGVRHLCL